MAKADMPSKDELGNLAYDLRGLAYAIRNGRPIGDRAELCDRAAELLDKLAEQQAGPVAAPEGWKLVPLKADEAMKRAGGHANSEWLNDDAPIGEARYAMPMESVWDAMLANAPKPPGALAQP